jgi:hypothetical protein
MDFGCKVFIQLELFAPRDALFFDARGKPGQGTKAASKDG